MLGKACGLDLAPLVTEARVTKGRADLLCADETSGGIVVVETQMGVADCDHAARLLKYASEYAASAAVLVAERFPGFVAKALLPCGDGKRYATSLHLLELRVYKSDEEIVEVALERPVSDLSGQDGLAEVAGQGLKVAMLQGQGARPVENGVADMLADCKMAVGEQGLAEVAADIGQQPAMLVLLRHAATDDDLVRVLQAVNLNRPGSVALVAERLDAATMDKVATLGDWVDARLSVFERRQNKKGKAALRRVGLDKVRTGTSSLMMRKKRMHFWEKVSSCLARDVSGRLHNKKRAMARSSHNVVYGLGKRGVRLAVLHQVTLRRLCAELRVSHANPAVAANRYAQLKDAAASLEQALSQNFEMKWLGPRGRKDEQVLRLSWKHRLPGGNPYGVSGLAERFADAVLAAEAQLVKVVGGMEDYRW